MGKCGPLPRTVEQAVALLRRRANRNSKGCLEYKVGRAIGMGYYNIRAGGENWYNHRLIFFYCNGYLPEVVRHSCDNPCCIEETHLLGGTHADNVADKMAHGNPRIGVTVPQSVINSKQAIAILNDPRPYSLITADYGITKGGISNIKSGRTWSHATGLPKLYRNYRKSSQP